MIFARILLFLIIASLLLNRWVSHQSGKNNTRTYRKEIRYYVIIAIAFLTIVISAIYIINPYLFQFGQLHLPAYLYWLGCLLMLLATLLWLWARYHLGSSWSPRITVTGKQSLVSTGPYRFMRHPMYASYVLQVVGIIFAVANIIIIAPTAMIALLVWSRIADEEKSLLNLFGDEYVDYMKRTKKFLF
jgi:protein-S-isoprenylcysteine O-methyltransferase Ste14